jgi:hypothetical protein
MKSTVLHGWHYRFKWFRESNYQCPNAAMGIRTPVASVRGSHDWPDYTIAAKASLTAQICG